MLPATNQINIGDSPPGPAAMVGSAPAASMDAVTSDMLLRAAQQQRRLASLLPDEAAQADVLALASQQEAQAAAILGGADATTPVHPWQQQKQLETSTSHHACAANAATAASAASASATSADPGLPSAMGISAASAYAANASAPLSSCGASATHAPINYVRAVLRRDSNDLFKLVLREKRTESFAGVVIAQLLESDSGDERAKLHEGDTLRTVNGLNPSAMRFDDLRAYVRDCPGALHIEVDRVLAWPPPLDAAASQWQDGASAATGRAAFVAPPGMDPTVGLRGSSGPGGDSVSGGTGSGAARLPPSLAPPRRFEPSEPPGDNLLGELGHRLGDKVKEVLEKPEVRELRGKAEETGREWLHGFRSLIDAGRETLEESGHSLRVIGDDLKSHAERMKESLSARGGGGGGGAGGGGAGGGGAGGGGGEQRHLQQPYGAGFGFDAWGSSMGHVRGSPPEGSAPALARSPLLHDSFGADGIGSHAPPAQLPHALQNPLVAPGQAAPSVLSDAEMDEATQLAIALSLSEQSQPPPVPPVSTAATSPQHAVGAESGMAPLDIWGRPMGSPGAQAVGADPFPAACYDGRGATAAKPPVEVMEPSMSESDQLALALELSLQEAKAREEALAAERAMVLEADRALVSEAVRDAAAQVDLQLKAEKEEQEALIRLGEQLLAPPTDDAGTAVATASLAGAASASSVEAAWSSVARRGTTAGDDHQSLIPDLVSTPKYQTDAELLASALGGTQTSATTAATTAAPQPASPPPPRPAALADDADKWMRVD